MKHRTKTALGIDVGRERVSLALLSRSSEARGWKVVRQACLPLPEGTVGEGGLEDVAGLARTLRKLRRHARIGRMKAAMTVSFTPLVMQMLDMPTPLPPNVGDFVEGELTQYVALSGRDIASDFCAVTVAGGTPRLLSVATETQAVRKLVQAGAAAGLTVEVVEPALLACARAVQRDKAAGARPGNRLIVEISACHLSACLLRRGMLEAVRVKDVPQEGGVDDVSGWFREQTEMMIRYYGVKAGDDQSGREVTVVVRDGVRLGREALAALRTVAELDAMSGEAPFEAGAAPRPQDAKRPAEPVSKAAVGLALKGLDPDGDPWAVNLLPEEIEQARSFKRQMLVTGNIAALIVLAMVIAPQFMTRAANRMRHDIERTKSSRKLYTTAALVTRADALADLLARSQGQLQRMQDVLGERNQLDWSALLGAIRDTSPEGVCITELSSDDAEKLQVRGLALSYEAVRAFARELGTCAPFVSASLARVDKAQGQAGLLGYQIDCLLKTIP
ncbi:MAG: pilus assembly protein PilM [Sedimentisphaerales bacterium]|nr:pilus assembly protein PilM [Sedimentisphaerales bacterium]